MGDFGDIGKSRQFVSIIYYLKLIFWQMNRTVIPKVKGKIFFLIKRTNTSFLQFEEERMMRR